VNIAILCKGRASAQLMRAAAHATVKRGAQYSILGSLLIMTNHTINRKFHSLFSNLLSGSSDYDAKADTILATNNNGIQAISLFLSIAWILSLVLSYARLKSVSGTKLEFHCLWQINTSWISLILCHISLAFILLRFYSIGLPILISVNIWAIYRILKGYLLIRPEYKTATA